MQLFTIGYEGLSASQFFDLLTAHQVETLIDVRAVAWSRKTGFAKSALHSSCHDFEMDYQHWVALGCPKDIREDYKISRDWDDYTIRYLQYLGTQQQKMEQLCDMASSRVCALMCFEADARFCHRFFLAQRLQEQMPLLRVEHLSALTPNPTGFDPRLSAVAGR